MFKRGVTSTTETVKKMGICDLNLITKPLDKLCVVHSFKRTTPPSPSLTYMYIHGKFPKIPENLFAMYS